jgi:hypothetical protein
MVLTRSLNVTWEPKKRNDQALNETGYIFGDSTCKLWERFPVLPGCS